MIRPLCWAFFLFLLTSSAFGIDLEVSSRFDNLYWNPSRADTAAGHTFTGADWFWNVQGSVTQDLAEGLQFKGGLEIDPILRSRAYAQLGFTLDNLSLKFAPFLGTFNSTQKWFNPGLEALVEYNWPGLLFVRGGFLTTFAPVSKAGDYYLSSQTAAIGFRMENGIVTFNIVDKSATFRESEVLTTVSVSTKYWLDTEMFLKNFPLHWAILTGFQITGRSYVTTVETATPVYSALLGARFAWDFGSSAQIYAQAESAVFEYGWAATSMAVPASAAVVQTVFGARYHW
jgi:hypothetical protein